MGWPEPQGGDVSPQISLFLPAHPQRSVHGSARLEPETTNPGSLSKAPSQSLNWGRGCVLPSSTSAQVTHWRRTDIYVPPKRSYYQGRSVSATGRKGKFTFWIPNSGFSALNLMPLLWSHEMSKARIIPPAGFYINTSISWEIEGKDKKQLKGQSALFLHNQLWIRLNLAKASIIHPDLRFPKCK